MSKLVYLSGPITGLTYDNGQDWRTYARDTFSQFGIEGLSPLRGKEFLRPHGVITDHQTVIHKSPLTSDRGITARDRFDAQRCDMMLVNLFGAPRVSIGTMIELGWADAARKPIVIVMPPENIHNHAIVRGVASYITDDLDEGIDIILTALSPAQEAA